VLFHQKPVHHLECVGVEREERKRERESDGGGEATSTNSELYRGM
jgi:hypothetical protein